VRERQYELIKDLTVKEISAMVDTIKDAEVKLAELLDSQRKIQSQIAAQEELRRDVAQFVLRGAEIIDKSQTSSCPLCEATYDSFSVLAQKVANNQFLSDSLSRLINERSINETAVHEASGRVDEAYTKITEVLERTLQERSNTLSSVVSQINAITNEIAVSQNTIDTQQQVADRYFDFLDRLKPNEFSDNQEKLEKASADALKNTNDQLTPLRQSIQDLQSQIEGLANRNIVLTTNLENLNADKVYLMVTNFFAKSYPSVAINKEHLNTEGKRLNAKISDLTIHAISAETLAAGFSQSIQEQTEDHCKKLEKDFETSIISLKNTIVEFERVVTNILGIEIKPLSQSAVVREVNDRLTKIDVDLSTVEKILNDLNLLSELRANVAPFLKYEQARRAQAEAKERRLFLEKKVRKYLEDERERVSKHLDEQINSFFYEGLINDLYRRIDPHPDYKRVKFICDFTEDKPKLNVCLYQDDVSKDPIIPNLYFSTAQINILSLSIFLAKALNAKDEDGNPIDCIFIDDPIQSMDSINVLSTIDLIRSLVVNKNKQIVLSTHDENFYNLLKKKIPSGLFRAKYLELETFGKVKDSVGQ
jgi:exonuclease SbcC